MACISVRRIVPAVVKREKDQKDDGFDDQIYRRGGDPWALLFAFMIPPILARNLPTGLGRGQRLVLFSREFKHRDSSSDEIGC